jgi:hypothetical protein
MGDAWYTTATTIPNLADEPRDNRFVLVWEDPRAVRLRLGTGLSGAALDDGESLGGSAASFGTGALSGAGPLASPLAIIPMPVIGVQERASDGLYSSVALTPSPQGDLDPGFQGRGRSRRARVGIPEHHRSEFGDPSPRSFVVRQKEALS